MPPQNYHNVSLDTAFLAGMRVKTFYKTTVIRMREGDEDRIGEWQDALRVFDITAALRDQTDLDYLVGFFSARLGPTYAFKITDPTDYECTDEYIGTGNGTQTIFPLVKRYNSGIPGDTHYTVRAITLPDTPIEVYVDDVLQGSGYTVDYDDGLITFTVAPVFGEIISWTGTYQVPVRFTTTKLYTSIEMFQRYEADIVLKEERAPIHIDILAEVEPDDFMPTIFPTDFSERSRIGPQFDAVIIDMSSGQDTRIPQLTEPRMCFSVSQDIKTFAEMTTLLHFFHARRGRLIGFYAQDISDTTLPFIPVRFNSDEIEISIDGLEIYNWSDIEMVEITVEAVPLVFETP